MAIILTDEQIAHILKEVGEEVTLTPELKTRVIREVEQELPKSVSLVEVLDKLIGDLISEGY